jgi:predicted nucleic acid-binding protein
MTAIDTNVMVALWDRDPAINSSAEQALQSASERGALFISAPVFAELLAAPGRTSSFVGAFLADTGIRVDWLVDEAIWTSAGLAFQLHAARRRKHRNGAPRRILADFVIGAHAARRGYRLLTLDDRFFTASFPDLTVDRV